MPTEDDAVGGLEAVLDKELLRFGLPSEAGLTGLLRHLEGSRTMTEHAQMETIRLLEERRTTLQTQVNAQRSQIRLLLQQVEAFENGVRALRENGQILALFDAEQYAAGLRDRLEELPFDELLAAAGTPDQEPAPESVHERVHEALRTRGKYAESQYDLDARYMTKTGKVLTDADIEKLAEEAEGVQE